MSSQRDPEREASTPLGVSRCPRTRWRDLPRRILGFRYPPVRPALSPERDLGRDGSTRKPARASSGTRRGDLACHGLARAVGR